VTVQPTKMLPIPNSQCLQEMILSSLFPDHRDQTDNSNFEIAQTAISKPI